MLGEPLKSMYSGDLQWIGVSKPAYWEVRKQINQHTSDGGCSRARLGLLAEHFRKFFLWLRLGAAGVRCNSLCRFARTTLSGGGWSGAMAA